jgi:hypothetical protein
VEALTEWFLEQGALGVICVLLIAAIVYQTRQLRRKDDQLVEKDKKVSKLQDARVTDQQAMNGVLDKVISAAQDLTKEAAQLTLDQTRSNDAVKAALASTEKAMGEQERAFEKTTDALASLKVQQGQLVSSVERLAK